jgi:hypothetical protein
MTHLLLALSLTGAAAPPAPLLRYTVDLNDRADSVFKVTLRVDSLPAAGVFQFASTAPGTYQVMDIGRYVRRFQAFDAAGRELETARLNTNQWRSTRPPGARHPLRDPRDLRHAGHGTPGVPDVRIVAENRPRADQRPGGVRISPRDAGRPHFGPTPPASGVGRGDFAPSACRPLPGRRLRPAGRFPDHGGPAHPRRDPGDRRPGPDLVYSKTDQIKAPQLLSAMRSMLQAAGGFLGRLPVDRYTFLFHFSDVNMGAWEHSYGSEYALKEVPYTRETGAGVTDMAAHEFFHVVTPLNLHSEIIEHFNFETPIPSRHLWLYEGTTEWAAHKMQLESGLKPVEGYLADVVTKIRYDRRGFDTTYSLTKLALTSYSDSGQRQ